MESPWKTWGVDFLISSRGSRLIFASGHVLLKLRLSTTFAG